MTDANAAARLDETLGRSDAAGRVGILFANLGTPDGTGYWQMRRYLSEFLSDKRVIDYPGWLWQPILQGIILTTRPFRSGANYRTIWNNEADESPLFTITRAQAAKLAATARALWGDRVMVDWCMRYGRPSTGTRVREMIAAGCDRILFAPLYPQYAGATLGTANDAFFRALMAEPAQPAARTWPAYFGRPDYIGALAASVRRTLGTLAEPPEYLVCSYHGLPVRYIRQGDPYRDHCLATTAELARALDGAAGNVVTTFQSRFGPEEWLQPYTVKEVARLAGTGVRRLAVVSPAFAADCVETLEEINGEIRESFLHAGGETFSYVPCLNDDDAHIAALVAHAQENLAGWLE